MNLDVGDVVRFYSPTAGKEKYHLCIYIGSDSEPYNFLFLNSGTGYKGDLILKNQEIPFLPPSKTGLSVVSCSTIVRIKKKAISSSSCKNLGKISKSVARRIDKLAQETDALTEIDRNCVLEFTKNFLAN